MSDPIPVPAPDGSMPGPRIPWGRMAVVHLVAGAVVAFFVVMFLFEFKFEAAYLGLLAAMLIAAGAALPSFLGARIAHRVAVGTDRGRGREIAAVVIGALVGSLVPAVLYGIWLGFGEPTPWIFSGIVAVASAIGFAIWVLVAWRRRPADVEPGAPPHS